MTSTRYVLTFIDGAPLSDYMAAAFCALSPFGAPVLESLDAIPERLRYMFREEVYVTLSVPAKAGQVIYKQMDATFTPIQATPVPSPDGDHRAHFKVSVSPEAPQYDAIGFIADIEKGGGKATVANLAAQSGTTTPASPLDLFTLHQEVTAAVETWLNDDENGETLVANVQNIVDSHVVDIAFKCADASNEQRDNLKAEVERLRVESSNHAAEAEAMRRERDTAHDELRQWLETNPPSLCSAHQRIRLDCRVCNPALAKVERLLSVAEKVTRTGFNNRQDLEELKRLVSEMTVAGEIKP